MTVYQLAEEMGITPQRVSGIINRKNLPYSIYATPTRMGLHRTRHLPKETVAYVREYHEARCKGHGMESETVTRFFKALVMARKRAGEPIDVGEFMNDYRNGGWRDA